MELEPHEAMVDGTFGHLQLGRKPTRHDPRTLRLADYLVASNLPPAPPAVPAPKVRTWPMYLNDRLGDCTIAAAAHMIEAWTRDAGSQRNPAVTTVERAYWMTGHPPETHGTQGGPTDDGRVELDVLNYWRKAGIGRDKIVAYVAVDPANVEHCRLAIHLLGGLYTGIGLPLTARTQRVWDVVGDGRTGDAAPWSWGGHAVPYVGYDQGGFTCVTWGGLLRLTLPFHAAYTDEAYAIVSPDVLAASGRSPEGLDLVSLSADLRALER